ncbi:MAG: imidazole glycerol phosphate synthase, glutamine amidotransferase subunit [Deltaproteobacteria bacterium RBG_13_65_10]|nr:MAG: imidazole glycerol phosphate synthase, glutamine amidotransferase subunit [Deltaproteobacteria bacterium RBG_13_65_10]
MIAIVDYGMGNVRSVQKAFERLGHAALVTPDPERVRLAAAVVLPGVGAFGDCMANLEKGALREPVVESIRAGKPFLGICLGLQLLFTQSEEFGRQKGLDLVPGRVVRFPSTAPSGEVLKVPHIGWNQLHWRSRARIFEDVPEEGYLYFVHSYYVEPEDPSWIAGTTQYGLPFTSAIARDNVWGVQFHPEKSQSLGLSILDRFGRLCRT